MAANPLFKAQILRSFDAGLITIDVIEAPHFPWENGSAGDACILRVTYDHDGRVSAGMLLLGSGEARKLAGTLKRAARVADRFNE
jgi:hypothetical protein